jgi:RPA family protein
MTDMEPAERVFAREFTAARHTVESGDASYVVTPTGAWCRRVFVIGTLTWRRGSGDVMQARVADPTDTFRVSADWQNPDAVETLGYIDPPAFIAVTGRAALMGSGPRAYTTIAAEAITVVDRTARDLWTQKTAGVTLDRLETLERGLSGDGDERIRAAIGLYGTTDEDIRDMAEMIWMALKSLRPEIASRDVTPLIGREILLAALGSEGIPESDAIARGVRSGLSAREARRALEELIATGECYQPTPDTVKLL